MRIMALDVGEKRIGVALSDALGITAQGLETYERAGHKKDMAHFEALVKAHDVYKLVVGLPVSMNGSEGSSADKIRAFGQKLSNRLQLPIEYVDERLTTAAVQRVLLLSDVSRKKRKDVVDKLAAVEILRGYLETQKGSALHE